jgi:hypothetical protein
MKAVEGDFLYDRIVIQHGGKDETDRSCTYREPLSQTSNYGSIDWQDIVMALREYVSNAIDATINYNEIKNNAVKFPFVGVEIAIVDESDVRAKKGFTRVFIPLTSSASRQSHEEAIVSFYDNIGKWFLHFSEPWSIMDSILLKKDRNIGDGRTAVLYRRGVRVRQLGEHYGESLFDYNLNDLRVDESRNIDDYAASSVAARAMSNGTSEQLTTWLKSFNDGKAYWEHGFSDYYMGKDYSDFAEVIASREKNWSTACRSIGENVVFSTKEGPRDTLSRKGHQVLVVPESVVKTAGVYGLLTPEKVLSSDERDGRVICEATEDALSCAQDLWDMIVKCGIHKNKDMPAIACFQSVMSAGSQVLGFYRDGTVYVNESIAVGQGTELQQTMLEELAHYVTGALDETRDLQDWAFLAAIKFRTLFDLWVSTF